MTKDHFIQLLDVIGAADPMPFEDSYRLALLLTNGEFDKALTIFKGIGVKRD